MIPNIFFGTLESAVPSVLSYLTNFFVTGDWQFSDRSKFNTPCTILLSRSGEYDDQEGACWRLHLIREMLPHIVENNGGFNRFVSILDRFVSPAWVALSLLDFPVVCSENVEIPVFGMNSIRTALTQSILFHLPAILDILPYVYSIHYHHRIGFSDMSFMLQFLAPLATILNSLPNQNEDVANAKHLLSPFVVLR
jgi:hypothetical protein